MAFKLTINRKQETVDVPADTPLLWVIRDVVGLKAVSYTHLDVYKRQQEDDADGDDIPRRLKLVSLRIRNGLLRYLEILCKRPAGQRIAEGQHVILPTILHQRREQHHDDDEDRAPDQDLSHPMGIFQRLEKMCIRDRP